MPGPADRDLRSFYDGVQRLFLHTKRGQRHAEFLPELFGDKRWPGIQGRPERDKLPGQSVSRLRHLPCLLQPRVDGGLQRHAGGLQPVLAVLDPLPMPRDQLKHRVMRMQPKLRHHPAQVVGKRFWVQQVQRFHGMSNRPAVANAVAI